MEIDKNKTITRELLQYIKVVLVVSCIISISYLASYYLVNYLLK